MVLTATVKEILEAQGYDPAEVQSAAINEETGKLEVVLAEDPTEAEAEAEVVEGEPMPEVEVVSRPKRSRRKARMTATPEHQVRALRAGAKRNSLRNAAGNQVVVTLYNEGFSKSGKTIKFQTPEDAPVWASGAIALNAFDGVANRKSIKIVVG